MTFRIKPAMLKIAAAAWLLGATGAMADTTLEFTQWWEPELPAGSLRAIMDDFEAANPGIKVTLVSGPYATTRDQISVGAATGTLSDVVGLDGAWVNNLNAQNALADMNPMMDAGGFDKSQVADIIKVDGKAVMFPVASFVYPVFVNLDLAAQAGVTKLPSTRAEFLEAAKKMTKADKNQYGWVLPLSLQTPSGVQNDMMSWVWASGQSMMANGKPDLEGRPVVDMLTFVKSLNDAGTISPGIATKTEQEKVEEFVNDRVGMMIDSLAHVNLIRKRNPKLNFDLIPVPVVENYTGKRGLPYASWGIGISAASKHQEEAWKLVQYVMSEKVNAKLVSLANAFPGNVNAKPDFVTSDKAFGKAFEIFKTGYLANEFTGLPVAEDLMTQFDVQAQKMLAGEQSPEQAAAAAQKGWMAKF
ncbi:sugar ABC transporter substrate-binding protein [Mesorhizobium sp. M7A.F.Ca.US.008.03.1.1]|uniref:ABC transporter substrate-binding protein n=1 Tax=Mesorhizobium sp. M7A.F.Ca.US.008.03.1.1 TaxID=2496742 RepID=UPI000FCA0491|nr:sugar ABC transporter substrate-binding protein [Mesorhizobium sp. M7A.F.Ca.US.008.03.1.1]RUW64111.1 sugar ABC transporter substrate-binding protein [Mesorhizobium sp. M7A.F.Ca.US.008.03.1.1]